MYENLIKALDQLPPTLPVNIVGGHVLIKAGTAGGLREALLQHSATARPRSTDAKTSDRQREYASETA